MSFSLDQISQQALTLNVNERATLAHALLQSIDAAVDANREEEWRNEIDRRVTQIDSGKAEGVSSETVFEQIDKKYHL